MNQKDLEDLTNALYDEGLNDDEVQTELSKLDSQPAAPAPAAPAGKPGLLSPETLAPATMAAINAGPQPGDSAMVQSQLDIQKEAPMSFNMAPGGMGMPTPIVSGQSLQAGLGAVSDWFGKGFRLAGSLVPSRLTRGSTQDPTAPMGVRTRTFTEAMQNPEGSMLTGLGEDIQNSNAPTPIKIAGKVMLGAGEGGVAGAAQGVAGQTVKTILAKAAVPAADVAEGAAKYVQNVRMGTNASDIARGASAGNAMKHGLGNKTLKNALPLAEQKIKAWSEARDAIYQKKAAPEISLESVERDAVDKINASDFGQAEKTAALDEIRAEVKRFANSNPKSLVTSAGYEPRPPVFMLSQDQIQAGVNAGEIKYIPGKKFPFEYKNPAPPAPENSLPKEGGVYLNLEQADKFKNWLQDAGAKFGEKGSIHHNPAKQKIFQDVYGLVTQRAEDYGGSEYAKLNKNLSEVIPIRNVIARTLGRKELGSDVVDKMGAIKATANAAASVTGINRFGATGVYDAAQGIKEAAQVPLKEAANTGAQSGFMSGMLRGSLSAGSR
jgi:hypothetical protein